MHNRTHLKVYVFLAFALIWFMLCWESGRGEAALVSPVIPKDSIRLRIIANSDSPGDQWIKRKVRDAIVDSMAGWVEQPQTIEAARVAVRSHLTDLDRTVADTLAQYGFRYSYRSELGEVPFPAKVYGDRIYPAGKYEAFLVTLGRGEGQNWWCVLFPPLCFISSDTGDAVPAKPAVSSVGGGSSSHLSGSGSTPSVAAGDSAGLAAHASGLSSAGAGKPEYRFFIWEWIKKITHFVKELF